MLSTTLSKYSKKPVTTSPQPQGYVLPVESVLLRIRSISKNENATTYDVCRLIAHNPMLQYDIISVANATKKSANKITDIYFAVMFLGLDKVEAIIQSRVALLQ